MSTRSKKFWVVVESANNLGRENVPIEAESVEINNSGMLVFKDSDDKVVVSFTNGYWLAVEEREEK